MLEDFKNRMRQGQQDETRATTERMNASLRDAFDALPPEEQAEMLRVEDAKLDEEIAAWRADPDSQDYANELQRDREKIVRDRAETSLYKRQRGIN